MGQFKPMVKMMTTEPTVELKLKKGGHVAGHSAMKSTMPMDMADGKFAPPGKAPKKPSIMERRKSMSGAMLNSKKGGVAKKADGGMMGMPTGAPSGAMMTPAMKKALMMRMMAQRGAMRPGMAAPAAPMAAPMAPAMKKGGKAGDMVQDKAMIKKAFKQHDMQEHMGGKGTKLKLRKGGTTKVVDGDKTDKAHGTGVVKMGKPGGYATGGSIPSETSSGSYKTTKMHQGKHDSASGTGGVRMANAGGFKHGGEVNWENRPADTAKPGKTNTKTGEVKESNAGGYKKGGAAKKHFATGGSVNDAGHAVAMPRKPVSRPVANTMQSGTFKKGGKVAHKAGGGGMPLKGHEYHDKSDAELKYILKDAGEAARAMKDHSPKSESKYLDQVNDAATVLHYRKNGITRKAGGGGANYPTADDGYDPVIKREADRRAAEETTMRRENEATPVMDSVKRLLGIRPNAGAGRGFVNPPAPRKAGGRAKC
jgi:hypothetical protein